MNPIAPGAERTLWQTARPTYVPPVNVAITFIHVAKDGPSAFYRHGRRRPAIHVFPIEVVDARNKYGHDGYYVFLWAGKLSKVVKNLNRTAVHHI